MVASGWRTLPVVFDGSMDQSVERKLAPRGLLERVINMRKDKLGRLIKRKGFSSLGASKFLTADTAPTTPLRLATRKDELIRVDRKNVHSFIEGESDEYAMRARSNPAQLKSRLAFMRSGDTSIGVPYVDCAVSNGYAVFAYTNNNLVYATVIELATGAIVHNEQLISDAGDLANRVICYAGTYDGDDAIITFWNVLADTKIVYRVLLTTDAGINAGFEAETPLVVDTTALGYYDISRTGTTATPKWVLSYFKTGDILRTVVYSDALGSLAADEVSLAGIQDISVYGEEDLTPIYVFAADSTNGARYWVYDTTATITSGPHTITASGTTCTASGIAKTSATTAVVVFQLNNSSSLNWAGTTMARSISSTALLGSVRTYRGTQMMGRPFADSDGQAYFPARLTTTDNDAAGILQITGRDGLCRAQPMPIMFFSRELNPRALFRSPVHVVSPATNEYAFPFYFDLNVGGSALGGDLMTIDLSGDTSQIFTEHADAAYASSSLVAEYDGQKYCELGFLFPPPVTSSDYTRQTSGGAVAQGIYQYTFVEEWIDRAGRVHQGPPCPAITVDMSSSTYSGGVNSVDWNIGPSRFTRKQDEDDSSNKSYFVMYRTTEGPGSIFYRVKIAALNDPATTSFLTTTDITADATIEVNETLYISASERTHEIAPASHYVTTHDQRLVGIDSEYRTRIWLTNQTRQGEGPEYVSANEIFVEGYGNLTALGSMDGKLYALTESALLVATWGDGPDATGGGQPFQQPQLLSKEAGCNNPRSVIVGPDGLYFAGDGVNGTGIYLWRRGDAGLSYVGEKVRDELTTYPIVTSAVHVQAESQIWFTVWNDVTDEGVILAYDYSHKDGDGFGSWSIYRTAHGDGTFIPFISGTYWKGVWVGARADGSSNILWKQSTGYLDDQGHIDCEIETGHIWPAGMNVPCRVKSVTLLLEFQQDSRIKIIGYDNVGAEESATFNVASGTAGSELLVRWQPRSQKRTKGNVKYKIQQNENATADSEGIAIHGLTLEFIPLAGTARLKAALRG